MTEPDFLRDTRASYDAVAAHYAERFAGELAAKPLDRAMLAGFAELVRAAAAGPVADIGCGTGRVTAYLSALGLPVTGIDLSPRMVAMARQRHPALRFEVGSMLALDLPDGALGGVLAWYSTIHLPDEQLPGAFSDAGTGEWSEPRGGCDDDEYGRGWPSSPRSRTSSGTTCTPLARRCGPRLRGDRSTGRST